MKLVAKEMIKIGYEQLRSPKEMIPFTNNEQWDYLLNDIENYSHLFVLSCVADKQIKASKAWSIPMQIGEAIGSFEFKAFESLKKVEYIKLFENNKYHRFNSIVGGQYFDAIQKIRKEYKGFAKDIWKTANNSATIFGRFLQFYGIGQKIASMAVNILVRDFKENINDLQWIDVSPDRHVIRVFKRSGIIRPEASKEEIIWKAKELCPEYPGVFDISTYNAGKNYCKPQNPNCNDCILTATCEQNIEADE